MNKKDVVRFVLGQNYNQAPQNQIGKSFAPSNIALAKYWGKRNQEINLPVTSSLSITLGNKGATTEISLNENENTAQLNGHPVDWSSGFGSRLQNFLNLFRTQETYFNLNLTSNIPISAGLASSACGFASITQALNNFYGWNLSTQALSILARLGSGSATRSVHQGFVEWHCGKSLDGMDCYSELIPSTWSDLRIGLLILNSKQKLISSRDAMQQTVATSSLYSAWPAKVSQDLTALKEAITTQDFSLLGKTAEANALTMHATMLSAWPPICYAVPETVTNREHIWDLRKQGLEIYFTQDAGPNLKLLFLDKDTTTVQKNFPGLEIIKPF